MAGWRKGEKAGRGLSFVSNAGTYLGTITQVSVDRDTGMIRVPEDLALRKIPTSSFEANAFYLEAIRLAYNLVAIFQRLCLPDEQQSLTLSKLRQRLFWLPGELTRPQNRGLRRRGRRL
jgi:hypothetical protein